MPNVPYTDLIVNEPDGIARIDLVRRDGSVVETDLMVRISSEIMQQASKFGAAEINKFVIRDENGIVTSNFITKGEW